MEDPKTRRNGQVEQPGIQYEPEGNGWPTPLTDESNPLSIKVTDGKSGYVETRPFSDVQATDEAPGADQGAE